MQAFDWGLITNQMVPLHFSPEDGPFHAFQKELYILIHVSTEQWFLSSIKESSSFLNAVLPNDSKSGMAPILIFGSLLSAQRFHQDSVNI